MTRTEVIEAFRQLGNKATRKQIDDLVGSSQQRVLYRMCVWKEIKRTKLLNSWRQSYYLYELLIPEIEKKEKEIIVQTS